MMDIVDKYNRLDWLDSAKALGMVFIYIIHCNIPNTDIYLTLFIMPLFFIISGFCWNVEKNANMKFLDFSKKKFSKYIIPYFKICSICFVIFTVILGLHYYGFSKEWLKEILTKLFAILIYSRGTTEWLPNCSPVWFLTCLFFAELLFYYIMKQKKPYVYVLCAGCIGFIMSLFGKIFPWNIDNAFSAIPLLYVGVVLRKYWLQLSVPKYLFALLPVALVIELYGIKGVDFDGNHYNNMLAMYIQSSIICLALLSTCNFIFGNRFKRFSMFGKNTIILFGYNYAINTLLLYFFPFVEGTWIMAILVILMGGVFVIIVNKFPAVKKIVV